jgi:purine-nucleoside phosphorylase
MRAKRDIMTGREDGVAPSITHPRQYLDYVMRSRGIELPDLPESCVITYCQGLLDRALHERAHITVDLGVTVPTHVHVTEPGAEGSYGLVAGRPGSPMAAVLLEELIELGFRRFVVFGSAGHPANGNGPAAYGQVVVPDTVYVYEGTSRHYGVEERSVPTDPGLRAGLQDALSAQGILSRTGPAATTDAFYRETAGFIRELLSLNVLAVEMELSALVSVARFRGCHLASLLCISDVVHVGGEWRVGLTSEEFVAIQRRILPVIESVLTR